MAVRQHGIVATWRLNALGYTASAVRRRVEAGRLHRCFRAVYAVGHSRLTLRARWIAAVLACGPEALLSHRSAAALWDLRPTPSGPIDVTVPARGRRRRAGIRVHSAREIHSDDRAELDGIPVTSVHRTLLDYAEVARGQQLRLALEAAERRQLLDGMAIEALIGRSAGRRGLKPLRAAIAELRGPAPWTQSELENRFLALIREAGIAEPHANVVVAGELVDFFWPRQRLVVEVDGYHWHKTRRSFEEDRLRDAKLQIARCRPLRVTQRRIEHAPRQLVSDVLELLGGPAASNR